MSVLAADIFRRHTSASLASFCFSRTALLYISCTFFSWRSLRSSVLWVTSSSFMADLSRASWKARLIFNGSTSLFTPKKKAIALVQHNRPATSPQTRLAVAML